MWVAFANAKVTHIVFSKNISVSAIFNDQSFNDMLTKDIISFEKLGPECWVWSGSGCFDTHHVGFRYCIRSNYCTYPYKCTVKHFHSLQITDSSAWGWLGVTKVSCILHHWGIQLILAYGWARPAILVAGKGRGGMFLFLLFLHFHSSSSFFPAPLFHLHYYLFYLFSPFLWETTQNDPQGLTCC